MLYSYILPIRNLAITELVACLLYLCFEHVTRTGCASAGEAKRCKAGGYIHISQDQNCETLV